jgi:acetyl-CoA C-acetyltransferase
VILGADRSATGTFVGSLAKFEPAELAGTVMQEAVLPVGVEQKAINYVSVGDTIPTQRRFAGVARTAAIQPGLSMNSTARSGNSLCASGLQGTLSAAQKFFSATATMVWVAASK